MKFSIVIPCFDHFDLTGQILMDIYQNCPTVDEVVVVDDCSKKEETFKGYELWERMMMGKLTVIKNVLNVGFLKSSNVGLKAATGDVVALISNDVKIKKDLVKEFQDAVRFSGEKILLGGRVLDWDTGWNGFNGKIFPYVEGWALVATKKAWEDFGYFDERFAPHDMEDVDLSTTALSKGYKLKNFSPWQGEVLEHIGAQSIGYTDERMAITQQHKELFRQKWMP